MYWGSKREGSRRGGPWREVWRRGAVSVAAAGVVFGVSLTAGGAGVAGADALCDQMREQYGPGWPCLDVPMYTPPQQQNEPPAVPGQPGDGSGAGSGIGGSPGEGPGEGNGTPIVGGPGEQFEGVPPLGEVAPPAQVPSGAGPARELPGPGGELPGRTTAPAEVNIEDSPAVGSNEAFAPPVMGPDTGEGGVPVAVWLLTAAAAVAIARPRPLLRRGGSTRGQVGPSRLVLIHDESSPGSYRFAMNVPEGGTTTINPDGSATIYDRNGNPVQTVARPWAFDAVGRPQKTWYEADENGDLIQHVEASEDAIYPILADPPGDTGGGLIAPTTGDDGADISAMPDTTGKQPGDTWVETRGGQDVEFTIPEGNGNQSVEMAYKNSDGQDSTALIVSDGEGGYQAWAQAGDGSAQYIDKDGPEAPGYSQWYGSGNDPANNTPNQITDANYNFTESTTYDIEAGAVTDSRLQSDDTYLNQTRLATGETNTFVKNLNDDGSYNSNQVGHMDADGESGWEVRDGRKWTIHRGEDDLGRRMIQYKNPETGDAEIDFYDEDGNRRIQVFNSSGNVVFQRFYYDDGFNEETYDENGNQTAAAFYDADGNLLGGTIDLGDRYLYKHPDGSSTVEMKAPAPDGLVIQHIDVDGTVTNIGSNGYSASSPPGQADPVDWAWGSSNTAAAAIDGQVALTEYGLGKVPPGPGRSAGESKILGSLKTFGLLGGVAVGTISDSQTMAPSRAFMTNAIGGVSGVVVGELVGAAVGSAFLPGVGTAAGWVVGAGVGYGVTKFTQWITG